MKTTQVYFIVVIYQLLPLRLHSLGIHIKPKAVVLERLRLPNKQNHFERITSIQGQRQDESFSLETVNPSRRRSLVQILTTALSLTTLTSHRPLVHAAVGTLPEFSDTNAILQGITVDVTQEEQLQDMISFLKDGFNFQVLRQRSQGSVTDTWMGFGPEQLSIPDDFEYPMSFARYGGHSSIHIRYDSSSTESFYVYSKNLTNTTTANAPGDNIAFLQVAVPGYRISQMIRNGGNVIDAYGIVNVISPCGLPVRGIVGIRPDPIMFLAINCIDVQQSRDFYEQQLGFLQQPYPYARPSNGTGQFEPPQPKGSVYLSPSKNSIGVLLLPYNQDKERGFFSVLGLGRKTKEKKIELKANSALRSLNIVYSPLQEDWNSPVNASDQGLLRVTDPSLVSLELVPLMRFEDEEKRTRLPLFDSV